MNFSLQVVDINDDISKEYLKSIGEPPQEIGKCEITSFEKLASTGAGCFALRLITKEGTAYNKFPVLSAADAWISNEYFKKTAHKLPLPARDTAAHFIKKACIKHGLSCDLITSLSISDNTVDMRFTKVAAERKHVIVEETGTTYALGSMYPLFSGEHVKVAADYFADHYGQFLPQDRRTFATNLVKRAGELGVEIDSKHTSIIQKHASKEYGTAVESQIRQRRDIVDGDDSATAQLNKIASVRGSVSSDEFAVLLSAWDSEHGIKPRGYLKDAYESTFGHTMHKEAGYTWEDSSSGLTLSGSELEKAASGKFDKIKGYFGETLATSLKKHSSSIFESLPNDAKVVIAKIAKGHL